MDLAARLTQLAQTLTAVAAAPLPGHQLQVVAETAPTLIPCDWLGLYLLAPDGVGMALRRLHGDVNLAGAAEAMAGPGLAAMACEGHVALAETELADHPRAGRLETDLATAGFRSALVGTFSPRSEPTDLAELTRNLVQALGPRAANRGQTLTVAGLASAALVADARALQRLISNLVDNALKYTPDGGRVDLLLEASGEALVLTVADTGIGIPAADIPRIFDRFYRVDNAETRARPGTGLGLAIARRIAEAHGGNIAVESAPGCGSAFRVRLPRGDSGASPAWDDGEGRVCWVSTRA